jgi:ribosome maturation factor RimP
MSGRKPTFSLLRKLAGCRRVEGESGSRRRVWFVMAIDLDKIRAAAERVAASHGLDVVDLEFVPASKHRALRIFIEKNAAERARLAAAAESSGVETAANEGVVPASVAKGQVTVDQLAWVTHEDCERFSVDFGTLIDVEDLVPGAEYTLEVSSPGLERRLFGRADYERFRGSLVRAQTFQPVDNNRHWYGRLTEIQDESVVLDLSAVRQKGKKKITAQTIELKLADIEKAHLVAEV